MKRRHFLLALLLSPIPLLAQLTAFESGGKWGFKNNAGSVVVPATYTGVGINGIATSGGKVVDVFTEGFAPVTMTGTPTGILNSIEHGKWGFIDASGKLLTPMQYDEVEAFHNGFAIVGRNGKKGLVNKQGKEVIPVKYDRVQDGFSDGLAMVSTGEKWGFVNESGKEVIAPKYFAAVPFSEGLAAVAPQAAKQLATGTFAFSSYGFIDRNGKLVIPAVFADPLETRNPIPALRFQNGQARVKSDGKMIFIDRSGNAVKLDLINSVNEIYVDSYNGFRKTASATVLEQDEAKGLRIFDVNAAPGAGKSILISDGKRNVYMWNYWGLPDGDAVYASLKAYMKRLADFGWNFKQYKLDYGVDKSDRVVLSLLEVRNGLPDPRTAKMRLTQIPGGFELAIL